MFGLTFEKLIIVGVVAAFVIGPERLPHYASVLAKFVRQLRDFTNGAKSRMKEEMGPDFDEVEWKKLDPRQYDPRRIIRDALLEDPAEAAAPVKPSSPMAAGAAGASAAAGVAGASAAAMAAAGGGDSATSGSTSGSGVTLDKFAPPGADGGAALGGPDPLAAEAGFDDSPGASLSVPAGSVADGTTDYLSGRKSAARDAVPQPALVAPHDSEAT